MSNLIYKAFCDFLLPSRGIYNGHVINKAYLTAVRKYIVKRIDTTFLSEFTLRECMGHVEDM